MPFIFICYNLITSYTIVSFSLLPYRVGSEMAQVFASKCGYSAHYLAFKGRIYTALSFKGLIPKPCEAV